MVAEGLEVVQLKLRPRRDCTLMNSCRSGRRSSKQVFIPMRLILNRPMLFTSGGSTMLPVMKRTG